MTMKNRDIHQISDFVISYFEEMGGGITPMKLQKLLYYIQSWHLVHFNHPLFEDEPEAWVNGPVYVKVYNQYKNIMRHDSIYSRKKLDMSKIIEDLHLNKEQLHIINETLRIYGAKNEFELVTKTHNEEPWLEARKGLGPFVSSNRTISHRTMKKYYKAKLDKSKA